MAGASSVVMLPIRILLVVENFLEYCILFNHAFVVGPVFALHVTSYVNIGVIRLVSKCMFLRRFQVESAVVNAYETLMITTF